MNENNLKGINLKEILVFFTIAVLVSAPFRLGYIKPDQWFPLPWGFNIFYRILRGIGPITGFIVMYYVIKTRVISGMSFLGNNKLLSILSVIPLFAGLIIAGVNNTEGFSIHYYGLLSACTLIVYAICEEYGWRGYLQQALAQLKPGIRIFVIAVLWYIWHLNFLHPDINWKMQAFHFGFLVLGAWGLLKISEITNSILFVSSVHLAFNIIADVNMGSPEKLIVIGISSLFWALLISRITRQNKENPNMEPVGK
jgi:uncharacterized protein